MVDATIAQSSHPQLTPLADLQWKWKLLRAAEEGTLQDVKALFELSTPFRKDPNLVDDTGCSALMNAALAGKLDIIRYLVEEQRADVNLCDKEGFAASTLAAYMGHTDVLRYLLSHPSYRPPPTRHTPLIAAASCHLPAVQMLVEEFKHDVNERGPKGFTPIMMAAQAGRLEIVRYLTRKGADLDIRNDQHFRVFDIVPSSAQPHIEKSVASTAPTALFPDSELFNVSTSSTSPSTSSFLPSSSAETLSSSSLRLSSSPPPVVRSAPVVRHTGVSQYHITRAIRRELDKMREEMAKDLVVLPLVGKLRFCVGPTPSPAKLVATNGGTNGTHTTPTTSPNSTTEDHTSRPPSTATATTTTTTTGHTDKRRCVRGCF